jgi:hypothetical protein
MIVQIIRMSVQNTRMSYQNTRMSVQITRMTVQTQIECQNHSQSEFFGNLTLILVESC